MKWAPLSLLLVRDEDKGENVEMDGDKKRWRKSGEEALRKPLTAIGDQKASY